MNYSTQNCAGHQHIDLYCLKLCTNLGVDDGIMETRPLHYTTVNTKKADCLRAYFNDGKANWANIVKAVTMHPTSNKRVAKQIAKTYGLDYNNIVKEELYASHIILRPTLDLDNHRRRKHIECEGSQDVRRSARKAHAQKFKPHPLLSGNASMKIKK